MAGTASYTFGVDTADLARARGELARLQGAMSGIRAPAGGGIGGLLGSFTGPMAQLSALIGGLGLGAAAIAGFKKAIGSAAEMETFNTSFTVLLGSASGAKQLTNDLNALSAATHLSMDQLASGAQTMLSFGIAGASIVPHIKELAEVSGGNAERFSALCLAFSQTASAGKLMGQDLLQYINAGFNPLQEISLKTGQSMATLRKEVEAGNVSFAQVADAFKTATSEGGRFYGFTEAQAKTWNGQMAMLGNRVTNLFREFGQPVKDALTPWLHQVVGSVSGLAETAKRWGKGFAEAFGTVTNLFSQGTLGEVLMLSLQIGFGKAVNYGMALLGAAAESFGILIGAQIQDAMDLIGAMCTKDFWRGMANALTGIFLETFSLLARLVAGILEKLSHAPKLGFLKKGADDLRVNAKKGEEEAADAFQRSGTNLQPWLDKRHANANDAAKSIGEVLKQSLSNPKQFIGTDADAKALAEKIAAAKPAAAAPAKPEPDRLMNSPKMGDAAAAIGDHQGKVDNLSDRLSKIGLFIGGNGGPQRAAENTARNTLRAATYLEKILEQRENLTQPGNGVFIA